MTRRGWGAHWALAVLVIWLPACRAPGGEEGPRTARTPASRTVTVTAAQITRRGTDPPYQVDVGYPQIALAGRRNAEGTVNRALRGAAEAAVAEFVESLDEERDSDAQEGEVSPSSLQGTYETLLLDASTASFRLTFSRYFSGAAHPSGQLAGLTFDLSTGKRYALADLFRQGAPYLERLSAECAKLLAAELGADADVASIEQGTAPRAESFAGWALTDTALEITFAEYQVGVYALGMPRCTIARPSLADLASERGPLSPR